MKVNCKWCKKPVLIIKEIITKPRGDIVKIFECGHGTQGAVEVAKESSAYEKGQEFVDQEIYEKTKLQEQDIRDVRKNLTNLIDDKEFVETLGISDPKKFIEEAIKIRFPDED